MRIWKGEEGVFLKKINWKKSSRSSRKGIWFLVEQIY